MDNRALSSRDVRLARIPPGSKPGAGTLQWSVGGWFGSLFGGTLWIALSAVGLLSHDTWLAVLVFGLFLGAIAVGLGLWHLRGRLAPHPAIQLMCLALFAAGAGTIGVIYKAGLASQFANEYGSGLPLPLWLYLGVYPLLMALLAWRNRRGAVASSDEGPHDPRMPT